MLLEELLQHLRHVIQQEFAYGKKITYYTKEHTYM